MTLGVQRRLAAILAADLVGYSRLIERAEQRTLARMKDIRARVIDPFVAAHGGRLVKEMGDGFLAEHGSVVEAVLCAVDIQHALLREPGADNEENAIRYRIGVNLGDVVVEGDDLFGDGVNIAARLEKLAEPGGIWISRSAFENVRGRVDIDFDDMGEQALKNISEPLRVFRVRPQDQGHAAGAGKRSAYRKPSLALLPIENISASPDLDAFAAGLSEDLLAGLAENSELSVTSRSNSFSFAGSGLGTQELTRRLGVDCILEGRAQGAAGRLRVTLQLTDGATGNVVWAERFDSDIADLFELQDQIVHKTLVGIRSKLVSGDQARIAANGTRNLTAWLRCNEAFEEWAKFSSDANIRAIGLFEQAIAADPGWSHPHAGIAAAYKESASRRWSSSPQVDLRQAASYAERAIELGPDNPSGYGYLAAVRIEEGNLEEGVRLAERAVQVAPNDFAALAMLGWVLPRTGELARSLAAFAKSRRVRPTPSGAILANEAFVAHLAGQKERTLDLLRQSLERTDIVDAHVRLAAIYADTGRASEARAAIARIITRQPDATIEEYTENLPFPDAERLAWYRGMLREAGLPART